MKVISVWPIDGERVIAALQEAGEKLADADGEVVLDFSAVRRLDPGALKALEELAGAADDRAVKIVLRGLNVEVYKVLKLMDLAPRFALL